MRAWTIRLLIALFACAALHTTIIGQDAGDERDLAVTFVAMDVLVDSGDEKLAAYQIDVRYDGAKVKIVGIEGGDAGVYNESPHYDRKGFAGGRIIIAAFTTKDDEAPSGRTRVARLHLQVDGAALPDIKLELAAAAKVGGAHIRPDVILMKPESRDAK